LKPTRPDCQFCRNRVFDEEAGNWHHRVPALHINGGSDAEALTLDVNVAPAA